MADFSFKNNKQIEIIKEMVKTSSDRYEINGIDLSKARFMWRKFQEAFQILSPGSYSIIQEAGNTFLKIDDTVLLGEAIEFQVIYVFDQESSQYIDDFPDVSILKEKYNELQRDFTNLNRLLKSNNITGDTLKMFYVLPELNEGEVWIRTKDGWKGTNVADLDKIVQDLINKIETQIKPDLTIWIQNELAKIQNRIDELMVHDYVDIPFLNKDVVQIYVDTATKTVRECDNTKFEPLSAVGLKFIKEDGTTVTRCYFRGVYDKPATLNIQDGVYWQTHTSADGLTLIQPQKWKSQAFELSNGKMYFDRGNPILIQGELGTIVFKEYETLNQAKADSSLVSGDYVIVTGDTQTNDGGQGVYQLVNGVFELRDFNRSFLGQKLDKQDTIEDLKKSTQYAVGDVVEVLGYYVKGDGANHKRKKMPAGYGEADAIVGADGSVWGIVHSGEVNVSWFGAKGDGVNDDTLAFENSLKFEASTIIDLDIYITNMEIVGYDIDIKSNLKNPYHLDAKDIGVIRPHTKSNKDDFLIKFDFGFDRTIKLQGLRFYGNNSQKKGIKLSKINHRGIIDHFTVGNFPSTAILFQECYDTHINDLKLTSSAITEGSALESVSSNNLRFLNSMFEGNGRHLNISTSFNLSFVNCKFEYAGVNRNISKINIEKSCYFVTFDNLDVYECTVVEFQRETGVSYGDIYYFATISDSNSIIFGNVKYSCGGVSGDESGGKFIKTTNSYNVSFEGMKAIFLTNLANSIDLFANSTMADCHLNFSHKGSSTRDYALIKIGANCILDSNLVTVENDAFVYECVGRSTIKNNNNFTNHDYYKSNLFYNKELLTNDTVVFEEMSNLKLNSFTDTIGTIYAYGQKVINVENCTISKVVNFMEDVTFISSGITNIKNQGGKGGFYNVGFTDLQLTQNDVVNYSANKDGIFFQNGDKKSLTINIATALDTPYHASNMQKRGILDSYHNYLTELHEYEKSKNIQSDSQIMNLNILQPPVIPVKVEEYAKEYNLL